MGTPLRFITNKRIFKNKNKNLRSWPSKVITCRCSSTKTWIIDQLSASLSRKNSIKFWDYNTIQLFQVWRTYAELQMIPKSTLAWFSYINLFSSLFRQTESDELPFIICSLRINYFMLHLLINFIYSKFKLRIKLVQNHQNINILTPLKSRNIYCRQH